MSQTCPNCGGELSDTTHPICTGCGGEPAWTTSALVEYGLGILLFAGFAALGLIEGAREHDWARVSLATVSLSTCVTFVVSQVRRPRFKQHEPSTP
jgi:hypothetical protein